MENLFSVLSSPDCDNHSDFPSSKDCLISEVNLHRYFQKQDMPSSRQQEM